ncbi:hypothetical protein G6F50_015419 [Rhizopus delemar]|uniref:Uncharacterized protein n=1 Tax=Rhizopus delemar TaxID=936053 RepID=A0A9P7C3P1_9FUNG|nr:hypothetical protein G6F50_015419 [Rhizopus delemar]
MLLGSVGAGRGSRSTSTGCGHPPPATTAVRTPFSPVAVGWPNTCGAVQWQGLRQQFVQLRQLGLHPGHGRLQHGPQLRLLPGRFARQRRETGQQQQDTGQEQPADQAQGTAEQAVDAAEQGQLDGGLQQQADHPHHHHGHNEHAQVSGQIEAGTR